MLRKSGIGVAVFAALALTVSIVAAGNAHFVGTPSLSTSGNTLSASGKVAGLGNIDQITVTVSGDAACINPGSKKPQAANKQTVEDEGDFPVQNGKANFSVTATATFQPDCTPPMSVEWSNLSIVVTDPAGNVLATFP
jgi:hypothetical protein